MKIMCKENCVEKKNCMLTPNNKVVSKDDSGSVRLWSIIYYFISVYSEDNVLTSPFLVQ